MYHDRKKHQLTAEALADYATSALMFSFLHCSSDEIDHALKEGHEIIESADMKSFIVRLIRCLTKVKKFSAKGESSWLKAKELICDEWDMSKTISINERLLS